jgi:FkbM family methyltransferase
VSLVPAALRSLVVAAQALFAYGDVMQSPMDLARYARLRAAYGRAHVHAPRADRPPVPLRLRALGGNVVLCRASQDVWTFKHTFLVGFHLPPAPLGDEATIVDLGSNVGYTVAHLAYRHPTARVIGVEMDAGNFALAEANTAPFGDRVRLVHAAVWTHDGEIAYDGDADDAFAVRDGAGTRRAPARRLDSLLDELGVEWVDYVKMDIEGAEAAIVGEDPAWLERVGAMKIEIHPPATYESLRTVLERRGFSCARDSRHWDCLVAVRA